ncbi:MAG TPA: AbrB/MazE/SpoVT family DNA-binding domain-containing protein [Firmicutes bacterium]|jgi:AbrB family looped-hinge helix DNA binding protein|nr:AbrB/MazE/SpoVT family DNA-binding domain-containing protein [Bacillota bacterium]
MHKTSLSTRGQIVIPAQIRNKLGLKPGTRFAVYDLDGKVVLVPELDDPVGHGLGFFNRKSTGQGE